MENVRLREFLQSMLRCDDEPIEITIFAGVWRASLDKDSEQDILESVGDAEVSSFHVFVEEGFPRVNIWINANLRAD